MRIGFYAPLKPPAHPIPSGDRNIARLFIKALEYCGHDVELISELRSRDGKGLKAVQNDIRFRAEAEVNRLLKKYKTAVRPDLIFTYHVYHKAPDWIGVEIAKKLNISYIIAEASFAPKQHNGPWHQGHYQSLKCIRQADVIIALNKLDMECINPLLKPDQSIKFLKPFLPDSPPDFDRNKTRVALIDQHKLDSGCTWLITVAMMRHGDKTKSYQQLSRALSKLDQTAWRLVIIGDGEASTQVKACFKAHADRCLFLGKLTQQHIYQWLAASDIFLWPAVNEAFGVALLEAQACGLPAVVQDYGGVSGIIENGRTGYITPAAQLEGYVDAIRDLICDKSKRRIMGQSAREKFVAEHSFNAGVNHLHSILSETDNP